VNGKGSQSLASKKSFWRPSSAGTDHSKMHHVKIVLSSLYSQKHDGFVSKDFKAASMKCSLGKNLTIKASHNWFKLSSRKSHSRFIIYSALRSGITVASEVYPRRGYCWLKTFPNTPQDDLKYSRLCNFWRPICGPLIKFVYVIAWGRVELRINFRAYFQSFCKIATRAICENFENTSENLSLILRGLNAITCL